MCKTHFIFSSKEKWSESAGFFCWLEQAWRGFSLKTASSTRTSLTPPYASALLISQHMPALNRQSADTVGKSAVFCQSKFGQLTAVHFKITPFYILTL